MVTIAPVDDQESPTDFNQRVGANLQRFRKAAGISQADLADALSQRGLSFQQPTILKVERGSRPLKFEEAHTIADILKITPSQLSDYTDDAERAAAIAQITAAARNIAEREKEITNLQVQNLFEDDDRYTGMERLAATGAVQDDDGTWHWRNNDGSVSTLSTGTPTLAEYREAESDV
jgi:transcriptional regulator with XRE-family HTH domain